MEDGIKRSPSWPTIMSTVATLEGRRLRPLTSSVTAAASCGDVADDPCTLSDNRDERIPREGLKQPGAAGIAIRRPTLMHIHIPKSAGTTINALVGSALRGRHFAYSLPGKAEELRAMSRPDRDRIDFIFGHFPYGLHRLFTRPVHYVASVREPQQRLLSFYRFVLSQEDHPIHDLVTRNSKTFHLS